MQPEQPQAPVNQPQPTPDVTTPTPLPPQSPVSQPAPQFPPEPAPQPAVSMPQTEPVPTGLAEPAGDQPIQWQAPEYVQERRSPWWFIGFWVVTALLMAIAAFVMRSWSFAILVPAMAATLMIYSHRPPRTLSYVLSAKGLYINEKLHPLEEFRSFGVVQDEALPGLRFIPVRRFRPSMTVHFPAEAGEAIVDLLGGRLPMEEVRRDLFDRLIKTLRI